MSAAELLAESARAGVSLRLVDGIVRVRGTPSPDLLTRLRGAKAELERHLAEINGRTESTKHPLTWLELDDWCRLLASQGDVAARRAVVRDWVTAAGGHIDSQSVHLPSELPPNLALATLKAHARALGLSVHNDPDKRGPYQ